MTCSRTRPLQTLYRKVDTSYISDRQNLPQEMKANRGWPGRGGTERHSRSCVRPRDFAHRLQHLQSLQTLVGTRRRNGRQPCKPLLDCLVIAPQRVQLLSLSIVNTSQFCERTAGRCTHLSLQRMDCVTQFAVQINVLCRVVAVCLDLRKHHLILTAPNVTTHNPESTTYFCS